MRKDGHVTGNIIEGTAEMPIILEGAMDLTDEQIDAELLRWIDYSVEAGVNCVFDCGIPGLNAFHIDPRGAAAFAAVSFLSEATRWSLMGKTVAFVNYREK